MFFSSSDVAPTSSTTPDFRGTQPHAAGVLFVPLDHAAVRLSQPQIRRNPQQISQQTRTSRLPELKYLTFVFILFAHFDYSNKKLFKIQRFKRFTRIHQNRTKTTTKQGESGSFCTSSLHNVRLVAPARCRTADLAVAGVAAEQGPRTMSSNCNASPKLPFSEASPKPPCSKASRGCPAMVASDLVLLKM